MPIVFIKNLGSDNEDDPNDANAGFLGNDDDIQQGPPPSKKRKLDINADAAQTLQAMRARAMSSSNKTRKFKEESKTKGKTKPPAGKKIVMHAWSALHSVSSSFVDDSTKTARKLQKMMLLSLKTTQKDLNFTFKPSHFLQVHVGKQSPQIGSLGALESFLKTYFKNIASANDDADNSANKKNTKDEEQHKFKPEWVAYTKSMQVMIVSPSVQRAVETMKALRQMRVTHSFYHKKQIEQMTQEEYDEYEQIEPSVIGVRVCELFGKHRKLSEQQAALNEKSWHLGIGGINRIKKLCQTKHLKLKKTSLILVDLQRNIKEQCLLDMPQMRNELCEWLQQYVLPQLAHNKTRIAFF